MGSSLNPFDGYDPFTVSPRWVRSLRAGTPPVLSMTILARGRCSWHSCGMGEQASDPKKGTAGGWGGVTCQEQWGSDFSGAPSSPAQLPRGDGDNLTEWRGLGFAEQGGAIRGKSRDERTRVQVRWKFRQSVLQGQVTGVLTCAHAHEQV